MSNNNEKNYLEALNSLENEVSPKDGLKVIFNPEILDLIEKIMEKMEWNLSVTLNSSMTHTISIDENSIFLNVKEFCLNDDSETIDIDLTIKNEARLNDVVKSNCLEWNDISISYVLSESITFFYRVLFGTDDVENEK